MKKLAVWIIGGLILALTPLLALMYVAKPSVATSAVRELDESQLALINEIAKLYYVENHCPSLEVNRTAIAVVAAARRLNIGDVMDGPFRPAYSRAYRRMSDEFVSTDEKTFCLAAQVAFGPQGVKIPDAIKLR